VGGTEEDSGTGSRATVICLQSPRTLIEVADRSYQGRPRLPSGESPMKTAPEG